MRPDVQHYLPDGSTALGTALLAFLAAWMISRGLRRLVRRLSAAGHISAVMADRVQTVVRWAALVLAFLLVLEATGLFANAWAMLSAVIATVAIGFFAVWSLLSNATGALLILTFRPFRHGDRVELVEPTNGTALGGTIVDINLMFTTLESQDSATGAVAMLQIPNNLFFQKLVRTYPATPPHETLPFYRESQVDAAAPKDG